MNLPMRQASVSVFLPTLRSIWKVGAVLKGCLNCDSENVKILGYGMLLEPQQGISVAYSKNVLIDGITVVNSRHYTFPADKVKE